jgi:hypothetical protein
MNGDGPPQGAGAPPPPPGPNQFLLQIQNDHTGKGLVKHGFELNLIAKDKSEHLSVDPEIVLEPPLP